MHTVYIYIYILCICTPWQCISIRNMGQTATRSSKTCGFQCPKQCPSNPANVGTRRAQLSSRSPPVKQPAQMWSNKAEFIHSLPIQLMVSMVILIKVHCDFNLPIQLTVRIWSMVILIKFTVSLSLHCHEFIRFTRVAETILGIQRMNSIGDL